VNNHLSTPALKPGLMEKTQWALALINTTLVNKKVIVINSSSGIEEELK
jgi:hypothetical protein